MPARLIAGRYRLQQSLSATVMSEVWTAVDPELERQVVVKLLAQDADRARFEREAQAAAGLSHDNIVRLFDYGEEGGRPYMVFEYLPGGSLEDRLVGGTRLSEPEATRIAADIAEGLAHAHDQGVIHRDLKPANVLFDAEGRAKIADFGIAQLGGADTLTEAGTILGTAAYMSPEQAAGEAATPASDVYSFGVVLYRMLTGRPPFEASNPAELAAMHQTARPVPLAELRPDVSPALSELTMSALAKRPEQRPASGAALAELLTLDTPPAVASEAATRVWPTRPRRRGGRVPVPVAAGFTILLLAVAGAVAAVVLVGHDPAAPPAAPVKLTPSTSSTHPATSGPTSTSAPTSSTTSARTTTAPSTSTRPPTVGISTSVPAPPPPPPTVSDTTATTTATTTGP